MSIATLLGFLVGIGLFMGSIFFSTNEWMVFIHLPSMIMVFGGTLAATFIAYEPRYVISALKMSTTILFTHRVGRAILTNEVGRIIRWGYVVQKSGMPGLEKDGGKASKQDKLLGFGLDLVIAGYSGSEVRSILATTVETTFQRNTVPAEILKNMGANAPAFGMIGTLVGLIIMLNQMGSDPSQLGEGMAIALVTTLYGVLAARLLLLPTASKLIQREEIVRFRNYMLAEGLALLAERKNPRFIQDSMNSYLDPSIHFNIDKHMKQKP